MMGSGRGRRRRSRACNARMGLDEQQVDPVLGRQQPLHPANLGVVQQLGLGGQRGSASGPAGSLLQRLVDGVWRRRRPRRHRSSRRPR